MRGRWWVWWIFVGVSALAPSAVSAATLADVFRRPAFAQLGLAPLGKALATTVASGYPVASASSSVVYEYNPALETFERRAGVTGPLFGERAETIGPRRLNLGLSYSYIHFTTIDGHRLESLPSRARVGGQALLVRVPDGVTLADGRVTTLLPVQVTADIDVTAHQLAVSATYGLTPHLDLNLTVPLLRTSLDLSADGLAPDPRFPRFALPGDDTLSLAPSGSDAATGVGDVLLRAKYLLRHADPVNAAVLLGLALPSGEEDDFQGAGTTRVEPMLILSRTFADRVEPFLNLGVDCDANDVDRSAVRWAVGTSAALSSALTAVVTFLGRNELGAQAEPIALPFFFQIERNDIYDASLGFRWRLADAIVSANVVLPLNREGLRADAIPTFDVEYAF